jgi:hypothetical protein
MSNEMTKKCLLDSSFQFQIIYLLHDDVKQDDQEAHAKFSLR